MSFHTHVTKRSKPDQTLDPPQFHVRPGPAPDPQLFERKQYWPTALACRIALTILQWTFTLWTLIKASTSRSWIFILQYVIPCNIPKSIQTAKARLTKIPQHLAVIVSNERTWVSRSATQWDSIIHDICNTCVWSSELGIKEISVFEQSGYLKRRSSQVQKQLAKAFEEYCMSSIGSNDANLPSSPSKGFKLSIYALEDGKPHVAQVTKQMAMAVTEGSRFTSDDINVQLVDKWMLESMTEPELAIICYGTAHDYIELSGFFPWHMRLTEFINIPSYKSISYPLFMKVMYDYSKVEQRFGR
ncbi:Decaprenyl diphosphate synthase-like protein [Umbelopsis sp. PMI_123]|nr:Decaprenyl diphosphate synthase-like protein [Umbelopsis sp. PMI_123]